MKLYLVRHGSAGLRHDDQSADTQRHIDADGAHQAGALVSFLTRETAGGAKVQRILSSPAARCVETVTPVAEALGLTVEPHDALYEGVDIETSWTLIDDLTAAANSAVLCSHGDVIPELIRRAKGRGMAVSGKTGCSKGSMWIMDWDGERFATGIYVHRPA